MKIGVILAGWLLITGATYAQKATAPAPKGKTQAQTVDDILAKYYEATGGMTRWDSLRSVRFTGKVTVQGMEIPVTIIQTADGLQKVAIKFQGQEITQVAYDGKQGWSTNFMTQKAEKMNEEANANMKQQVADFPDAFLNYRQKGYVATMEGKDSLNGAEVFKIRLIKKPVKIDGVEQENIVDHYFDTNSYYLVATRSTALSGPMKGAAVETILGDYREVRGLYFPFLLTTRYNEMNEEVIRVEQVATDVVVDPAQFTFPE